MNKDERDFLRIYHKAPAAGQLAALCMLYVGADPAKTTDASRADLFNTLKTHTKGELKRAIKTIREQQSRLAAYNNGDTTFYETTIAFIRRELLGKGAAA